MTTYNKKREPQIKETITHEGGTGYTQSDEATLIGILSTGLDNTYYENMGEREIRFAEVLNKVAKKNKIFAAKSLIYARTVFGQRTVTHRGAVELIPYLQGDELGKRFFSKRNRKANEGGIIYRLDDMTEILACYLAKNGENASIPNSIKKGFKDAIENADAYQLAKYQMKGKNVSLVDIVNLVHPNQTKFQGTIKIALNNYFKAVKGTKWEHKIVAKGHTDEFIEIPTLHALILGILTQFNTVEDKNTKTGQTVAAKVISGEITQDEAKVELNIAKTENYKELIETKKIGYLALLRNVRNILKTDDFDLLNKACNLLTQETFIKKSLVFPHQIDLALEIMLIEFSGAQLKKVAKALSEAYELSIPNISTLFPTGKTAVVYDTSGSMGGGWHNGIAIAKGIKINSKPVEKAALIAATLAKGIDGDVYQFGTSCRKIIGWNPLDSVNSLKQLFISQIGKVGHGTAYSTIFPELDRSGGHYDRVFIITDEQAADSVERSHKAYCNKYGTPHVYFINLCGYSPTVMKANTKVHRITGYHADIYELAKKSEVNPNIIIKEINAIVI